MVTSKRFLAVAVVTALGIGAGFAAWPSTSVMTTVRAGAAILFAGNLILCLVLWARAEPGSGDAMVLPTLVLISASMLLGIVPRLLWPAASTLHIAASVASVSVLAVVAIRQIHSRRRSRPGV